MQIKRVITAEGKGGVAIQTDTINTDAESVCNRSARSYGLQTQDRTAPQTSVIQRLNAIEFMRS